MKSAVKKYKAMTNGLRGMSVLSSKHLTKKKPEKRLLKKLNKKSGRNNQGKITVRHHGGGAKQKYRIIDFKRRKEGIIGIVSSLEYDPNRNVTIALINYKDGEKKYILAPKNLQVKDQIISGSQAEIKIGNALPLKNIPVGTSVHNIELKPGFGGQMIRSAGTFAKILGKEERFVSLRLQSGEVRKVLATCFATIGVLSNEAHKLINIGKAGKNRHRGKKPTVRGSAMNPNDHPHGGGEGKAPIGRKQPMTPWGKKALGVKTRNKKKYSNKLIIRRRNAKK